MNHFTMGLTHCYKTVSYTYFQDITTYWSTISIFHLFTLSVLFEAIIRKISLQTSICKLVSKKLESLG